MKKIILLLFTVTAFICQSCQEHNRPYDQYPNCTDNCCSSDKDYLGPQDGNHDLPHYGICDDYYNRYDLADESSIIVTKNGTLAMYDDKMDKCHSLCWADCALYRNGHFLEIYRYDYCTGQMAMRSCYNIRKNLRFETDISLCCYGEETLSHRELKVANVGSIIFVSILNDDNSSSEHFQM